MRDKTMKMELQTEVWTENNSSKKVCGDNIRKYWQNTELVSDRTINQYIIMALRTKDAELKSSSHTLLMSK